MFLFVVVIQFCLIGVAIEAVSDSSRYFVIRVVDDNGKYDFDVVVISLFFSRSSLSLLFIDIFRCHFSSAVYNFQFHLLIYIYVRFCYQYEGQLLSETFSIVFHFLITHIIHLNDENDSRLFCYCCYLFSFLVNVCKNCLQSTKLLFFSNWKKTM